ncbi:MAG TPA: glycosyl hydrolase [Candidatus Didemnitutus sp.]|nr:glycosyl hydrolase [Candidatus Didemnitutus sp.]
MKTSFRSLVVLALVIGVAASAGEVRFKPVTPDASPEAVALLDFLQEISGRYTLTGQHNPPVGRDRNSLFAGAYTGKMPAVWTSDFGFAGPGDSDSTENRPAIVQEAIRQHRLGSIISLCWHAVPPTADEPVTFQPVPGADPAKLHSVQGKLTDEQFRDILTPGTALYNHWAAQVDVIAGFLKQLQDAHVPVIWRPYHEMNGDWFWWGGRIDGPYTTQALYRQLFDRFVYHHHLKNLIWLWSTDRVHNPAMEHAKYFPGMQYVDVLGLDVYGGDFAQSYYDSLVQLSQGKPLALAEVGTPPHPEVMAKQPLWTYYAIWTSMVRNTTPAGYADIMSGGRMLGRSDPVYAEITASYRRACGLPVLTPVAPPSLAELAPAIPAGPAGAGFSGSWVLDEAASKFGPMGAAFSPARLVVNRVGTALDVKSYFVREYKDDDTMEVRYALDGSETKSQFMRSERVTVAKSGDDPNTITMETVTTLARGTPPRKLNSHETWTLTDGGTHLVIHNVSDSFMNAGQTTDQTFVFDRH